MKQPAVLLKIGRDTRIRPVRVCLNPDGSIDHGGRTYLTSRDARLFWPTKFAMFRLSRGVLPAYLVLEEHATPLVVSADGGDAPNPQFDDSHSLNEFKRMTLARQLVNAASKESTAETLKWLVIGTLALAGLAVLMLFWLANSFGLFSRLGAGGP